MSCLLVALAIHLSWLPGIDSPDLSRKVSFTSLGEPVEKVIADLSVAAGLPLRVAANESGEVVAVRSNGVSIGRLLDEIAKVTFAEWIMDEQGRRWLTRTKLGDREAQEIELSRANALYEKAIDAQQRALSKMQPLHIEMAQSLIEQLRHLQSSPISQDSTSLQVWRQIEAINRKGPAGRVLNKLLCSLEPKMLGSLPEGIRIGFSTEPKPSQRSLPKGAGDIAQAYVKDQTIWLAALARSSAQHDEPKAGRFSAEAFWNRKRPIAAPRILLFLTRGVTNGEVRVDLRLCEPDGNAITNLSTTLSVDAEPGTQVIGEPKTQIEPRSISQRIARAFRKFGFGAGIQKGSNEEPISEEVRQILLKPDQCEPLSYLASDLMLGVAKAKGLNMVASIPDAAFVSNWAFEDYSHISVETIMRQARNWHIGFEVNDGFLRIRSTTPLTSRYARVPRTALGRLLRGATSKGLDMENIAAYACASTESRERDYLGYATLSACDAISAHALNQNDWSSLRIYGGMTPAQRLVARQGQSILLTSLSSLQQNALNRVVYGPHTTLIVSFDNVISDDEREWMLGLGQEPTEAMPRGFAPDATLTLKEGSTGVLFAAGPGAETSRPYSAEQVAQVIFTKQRSNVQTPNILSLVRFANQPFVTLDVRLSPLCLVQQRLSGPAIPGIVIPFTDLRGTFRSEIAAKVKELEDMNRGSGTGGNTAPPPH